jgi:hypothetical protein
MRFVDCGKMVAQPLCMRLADMQRGTDSAYRWNTISRQVSGEHHFSALRKRIGHRRIVLRARLGRRCLGARG